MSSLLPRQPPLPQCPAQLRKSLVFTITSERVLVTSPGWSLGHHGNTTSGICLLLLMRSTCGFNPWELNSAGPAAALCREGMPPMLAWATGVHRSLGPLHLRRHRHSLSATDPGGGGAPGTPNNTGREAGPRASYWGHWENLSSQSAFQWLRGNRAGGGWAQCPSSLSQALPAARGHPSAGPGGEGPITGGGGNSGLSHHWARRTG